jgi:hypothetical protein
MPRPLSGPVHQIEVSAQPITFCDGAFVGDREIIKALKVRLVIIAEPTTADVEEAARALCARRGETFVGCSCDVCLTGSDKEKK